MHSVKKNDDSCIRMNLSEVNNRVEILYWDNGKASSNMAKEKGKGSELIKGIIHHLGGTFTETFNLSGYSAVINLPNNEK